MIGPFNQRVSDLPLLLFSYLFSVTMCTVLPFKIIWAQRSVGSLIVLGSLFVGGWFVFTDSLWLQIKAPSLILVKDDRLILHFYLDRVREVPFASIIAVKGYFGSSHAIKIQYEHRGRGKYFFAHIDLLRLSDKFAVGHLIEAILDRALNLREVEVRKFIDLEYAGQSAWTKLPDWRVIDRAEALARENQKK